MQRRKFIRYIELSNLKAYDYMGDRFVDVIEFFQTITNQSNAEQEKYNEFSNFINHSAIYKVKKGGMLISSTTKYQNFSGLGMFLPYSQKDLDKYRYLPVFSELKLAELFDALLI